MEFENLDIRTKSDMISFIDTFDKCQNESDINHNFPTDKALILNAMLVNKSIEELKKDVKKYLYEYKDIVIYTSFEPSSVFVSNVCDMFSNDKKYLLDFKTSEEIIGGIKISKDGKMYDESFSTKLNNLLK